MKMHAILTIIKSEKITKMWRFATKLQRVETTKYNHLENEEVFLNHTTSKMFNWLFRKL